MKSKNISKGVQEFTLEDGRVFHVIKIGPNEFEIWKVTATANYYYSCRHGFTSAKRVLEDYLFAEEVHEVIDA